jgi:hypothetical protein
MNTESKLPVWGTVAYSYDFVWRHRTDLARFGWLPLLLVFATGLYFGSFDPIASLQTDLADSGPAIVNGLLGALMQGAISVIVLVAWHRLVMREYRGAAATYPVNGKSLPGRRESLYFLQMLLLSVAFLVIWLTAFMAAEILLIFAFLMLEGASAAVVATADPTAASQQPAFVILGYMAAVIGLLPAFYVSSRLSLALPQTATEQDCGKLSGSWGASAGNGWRMVFATILALLPIEAFNLAMGFLAHANAGKALYYPLAFVASIGLVVLMAVLGTVLSRCYAYLQYHSATVADDKLVPATG